jgi:putative flippase GtrA
VRFTAFSSTTFYAERRAFARYFLAGGACAVVDIGLFMLFAKGFGLPYLRVATATFLVATLLNYVLSVRFVFVSGKRFSRRWEIALVFLVSGIGLAMNSAVLWLGVEVARVGLFASKLTATGAVFAWNYLARRHLVFGATRS